jgi:hypothetical protein
MVKAIHDKGVKWFVDIQSGESPERIVEAINAGLDGIQTDNPDWVLAAARRKAAKESNK